MSGSSLKKWKINLPRTFDCLPMQQAFLHLLCPKIDYKDCPATYVGQTKRQLQIIVNEHQNDIKKNPENHSVVSKQISSYNYKFFFKKLEF